MKHIVLPTDFNMLSLQPVHDVLQRFPGEQLKITPLHLIQMPTGIGDLLFRNRRIESFAPPPAFLEACEILANRYEGAVSSIRPVVRYGSTAPFLDHLLEALQADVVAVQAGYKEQAPFAESVPLMPLIYKCSCPVLETPVRSYRLAAGDLVGNLLLSNY